MRTLKFITDSGTRSFDKRASAALAIMQCLMNAGSRGMTVEALLEKLVRAGVQTKRKREAALANLSSLLQQLIGIGVIRHPCSSGGTHRYVFERWPLIQPA